jgi:hypothetical protein
LNSETYTRLFLVLTRFKWSTNWKAN